jgi:hypothetical protein
MDPGFEVRGQGSFQTRIGESGAMVLNQKNRKLTVLNQKNRKLTYTIGICLYRLNKITMAFLVVP